MGTATAEACLLDPGLNWEKLPIPSRAAAHSKHEGTQGEGDGQHRTAVMNSVSVVKSETSYDPFRQLNQGRLDTLQKSPAHTFVYKRSGKEERLLLFHCSR